MAQAQTWEFRTADIRRSLWGILLLLAAFTGILTASFAVNLNLNWLMALMLITFLGGGFAISWWIWRSETVTLYHDRIISAIYGDIYLDDIIKITRPLTTTHALKLHLGKRKIRWQLGKNSRSLISSTDAELAAFGNFTYALEQLLEKKQGNRTSRTTAAAIKPTATAEPENVVTQLKKANKGMGKQEWTVYLGLLLAALGLVRACGHSWFKRNDIRGMKTASEQMFVRRLQETNEAVAARWQKEGPAFLYTNDKDARIRLFPDMNFDNPLGMEAFMYVEANRGLEAFLTNKDSAALFIYVVAGDSSSLIMRPQRYAQRDSSARHFYFRAYDPQQRIRPAGIHPADTSGQDQWPVFNVSWEVEVKPGQSMYNAITESMPGMPVMVSQVRLRPTFRLYMTGRTGGGMDAAGFREAVQGLNQLLKKHHVDTSLFVNRQFN
ncbi:hypothetical protein [Chitinophaga solisilvae]|uniref:hypothetical protein n=1 Tax=Chitinophaga solisilvae TaxID=1233460 RepID=UPI00136D37FD|nr:hypothetical protein [Chitinophaga solisilvae]